MAIGVDPGNTIFEKLRYGKICILADADSDGLAYCHFIMRLFVKTFSALVKAGSYFCSHAAFYIELI